jgi:hypothetical protein
MTDIKPNVKPTAQGLGEYAWFVQNRECMCLLEYQAMPSLRDVDYDGWFCTFTIQQELEISLAHNWAALVRATRYSTENAGGIRPVHHIQNHICRVTLLQLARRASVLDQPSSVRRPHWCTVSTTENNKYRRKSRVYTAILTYFTLIRFLSAMISHIHGRPQARNKCIPETYSTHHVCILVVFLVCHAHC